MTDPTAALIFVARYGFFFYICTGLCAENKCPHSPAPLHDAPGKGKGSRTKGGYPSLGVNTKRPDGNGKVCYSRCKTRCV